MGCWIKVLYSIGQEWQMSGRRDIERLSSEAGAGPAVSPPGMPFQLPRFFPDLGSHVQCLDFTASDSSQFSVEVRGEVVGQEVRSGQARVLVKGLLCDLKAHCGIRNSSQELL